MENYCRGLLLGMFAGACIAAVVVAKNKKLSKKINDGVDMAVEKVDELKQNIEDKKEDDCIFGCSSDSGCFSSERQNSSSENDKNNFYKKAKNK